MIWRRPPLNWGYISPCRLIVSAPLPINCKAGPAPSRSCSAQLYSVELLSVWYAAFEIQNRYAPNIIIILISSAEFRFKSPPADFNKSPIAICVSLIKVCATGSSGGFVFPVVQFRLYGHSNIFGRHTGGGIYGYGGGYRHTR